MYRDSTDCRIERWLQQTMNIYFRALSNLQCPGDLTFDLQQVFRDWHKHGISPLSWGHHRQLYVWSAPTLPLQCVYTVQEEWVAYSHWCRV